MEVRQRVAADVAAGRAADLEAVRRSTINDHSRDFSANCVGAAN